MTEPELDQSYTALCQALGAVGQERAEQFLAMLSMALLVRVSSAAEALAAIAQVQRRCLEGEVAHG